MEETGSTQNNFNTDSSNYVGKGFIDFLTLLVTYRRFVFWFVLIVTFSATIYALVSPKWYKSTASVLPSEETDFLGSLLGVTNMMQGFSSSKGLSSVLAGSSEADRFIAILKSGTITGDVINKFDLRKVYDMEDDYVDDLIKEFNSNVEIELEEEGNLTIDVFDKSPQRAADIANYMVTRLNEINTDLNNTNAKANRQFIEKRYNQNLMDIDSLETEMITFQKKFGVVDVPEQLKATIQAMTNVYTSLAESEIQYNVLKRMYSEDNPTLKAARIRFEELKNKINSLNRGDDEFQKNANMLIPFKKAPEMGSAYLKIYKNLEIQYTLLEFITPFYEQAKVEEARNTPSVLVLDYGYPAERKAKPKVLLYFIIAFITSLMLSFLFITTAKLFDKIKNAYPDQYNALKHYVMLDIRRIFFLRKK